MGSIPIVSTAHRTSIRRFRSLGLSVVSHRGDPPVIRPEQALRDGRGDAATVVVLWLLRRSFVPLALFGSTVAWIGGRTDTTVEWSSPSRVVADLLSPLALVIVAFVVRIGAAVGALLAVLPVAHRTVTEVGGDTTIDGHVGDSYRTAKALRALRWTGPVRRLAIERLGPRFGWIRHGDTAMTIAAVAGFVSVFAAVLAFPST